VTRGYVRQDSREYGGQGDRGAGTLRAWEPSPRAVTACPTNSRIADERACERISKHSVSANAVSGGSRRETDGRTACHLGRCVYTGIYERAATRSAGVPSKTTPSASEVVV
jgi:hypothetical protein